MYVSACNDKRNGYFSLHHSGAEVAQKVLITFLQQHSSDNSTGSKHYCPMTHAIF